MHTRQIMMTSNHMKPRSSSSSTSKTGRSHSQIWISFDRKASFKCILLKLIINFHPRSVTILRWLLVNDSWPCIYYLEMRRWQICLISWEGAEPHDHGIPRFILFFFLMFHPLLFTCYFIYMTWGTNVCFFCFDCHLFCAYLLNSCISAYFVIVDNVCWNSGTV